MTKLNPSNRLNRRYLLVSGSFESIEKAILEYIGVLGYAKAAPIFVAKTNEGIIFEVNRESLIEMQAAFCFSNIKYIIYN